MLKDDNRLTPETTYTFRAAGKNSFVPARVALSNPETDLGRKRQTGRRYAYSGTRCTPSGFGIVGLGLE